MTEVQRYEVVGKKPGFEIRQYAPHVLVTKSMSGSLSAAGSNAFRYLAGYIGGENADRQQIAMTAPVLQHKQPSGYEVAFVMPDHMEDAPAPLREGMEVKKVDGVLMAAKRFSGLATDELFERKGKKLLEELRAAG
ncbi:MAG: SOUL family heme-binding protein, partial [Aquiluna sp.]